MPAIVSPGVTGQRTIIDDIVYRPYMNKTPFMDRVKKGPKPRDIRHTYQLEQKLPGNRQGLPDGKDPDSTNTTVRRTTVTVDLQRFTERWSVGHMAENYSDVGGVPSQKLDQMDNAMQALLRSMERNALDTQDQRTDDGSPAGSQIRGMGKWLTTDLSDVNSSFRVSSDALYAGVYTGLTETDFELLLEPGYDESLDPNRSLVLYCGNKLKQWVSSWMAYDSGDKTSDPVYRFNGKARTIERVVDILQFDTGRIELVLNPHILSATRTLSSDQVKPTALQKYYGLVIDHSAYTWMVGAEPGNNKQTDEGGGPRGFIDAVGCPHVDPRMHAKILATAT